MFRLRLLAYAAGFQISRPVIVAAGRIWLNRATHRSGDCLVADLQAIEAHGTRVQVEPPYETDVQDMIRRWREEHEGDQ